VLRLTFACESKTAVSAHLERALQLRAARLFSPACWRNQGHYHRRSLTTSASGSCAYVKKRLKQIIPYFALDIPFDIAGSAAASRDIAREVPAGGLLALTCRNDSLSSKRAISLCARAHRVKAVANLECAQGARARATRAVGDLRAVGFLRVVAACNILTQRGLHRCRCRCTAGSACHRRAGPGKAARA